MNRHKAFTLIELLVTISIIVLLSAFLLSVLSFANQEAKNKRTESTIKRINTFIETQYNSYNTRITPQIAPNYIMSHTMGQCRTIRDVSRLTKNNADLLGISSTLKLIGKIKVDAIHELMRMELPDRLTDLQDIATVVNYIVDPDNPPPPEKLGPTGWKTIRRRGIFLSSKSPGQLWTKQYEDAECLYLIILITDRVLLDKLDIMDNDGDGVPEIVDGWKRPLCWIRWPIQLDSHIDKSVHEEFDVLQSYSGNYLVRSYIGSAGPDGEHGLLIDNIRYSQTNPPNNPYGCNMGQLIDYNLTVDNITN